MRHGRLKLRVINDTDGELIAYSRAEEQDERVSSYEKIRVEDSAGLRRALSGALGVLTEVKKERILFIVEGSRVHLDTVEGLGFFVEFEVPIDATTNGEHTMKILRDLFRVLDSDVVRVSYSDLQLVNRERECS